MLGEECPAVICLGDITEQFSLFLGITRTSLPLLPHVVSKQFPHPTLDLF